MKKHKTNLTRRTVPEHFHSGDDDGDDGNGDFNGIYSRYSDEDHHSMRFGNNSDFDIYSRYIDEDRPLIHPEKHMHESTTRTSQLGMQQRDDTTQQAPTRTPKLGPSTSSYFPFSAHQTRRVEESERKTDISQSEHKEVYSDDKMPYEVKPSDISKTTGKIGMIALGRASKKLDAIELVKAYQK